MSRKTLLDEGKKREIIAIISIGCSRMTAARYVGCDPRTISNEIRRDNSFATELAHAEEQSEVFYIQKIRKAVEKESNWRAAAWMLERRLPNRYAARGAETLVLDQVEDFIRGLVVDLMEHISDKSEREKVNKRVGKMLQGLSRMAKNRTKTAADDETE